MAFGFGFNKAKVLSAAEKYVQQGKLQNAIAEYEKILKEDQKDLTVLNTVGDLYARVGQTEKAAAHFRKVGDAYATDGFTVKAIALYKKLTKLHPAPDFLLRLADLYTHQGLYNDARAQYVQVADQHMKKGELDQAAQVFKKMLELDPENSAMQTKLADIYVRIGKKQDARDIFMRAAESLIARGSADAAADSVRRVLSIEPGNVQALTMGAKIALESGKDAKALEYLKNIPDVDSRADVLQTVLGVYLQAGKVEQAAPIAQKLLTGHNDVSGMRAYADALMAAGSWEMALHILEQHADRLIAADSAAFAAALNGMIGRLKENSDGLELLLELYQKTGDNTHVAEISELMAHAYVQAGELAKARDVYKRLAELEPGNKQHMQNYQQMVVRIGEDATVRPLTPERAAQPVMAEELEFTAPALEQQYPDKLAAAIDAAITDSELFASYNAPAKAIAPLEAILPKAPNDVRLNQRLISLYSRCERFRDAGRCCTLLQGLYKAAGFAEQARQYGDMAAKYAAHGGAAAAPAPKPAPQPTKAAPEPAKPGPQPTFEVTAIEEPETPPAAAPPAPKAPAPAKVEEFTVAPEPAPPAETATAPVATGAHEIDLSEEWDSVFVAEPAPTPEVVEIAVPTATATPSREEVQKVGSAVADLLEEIQFYLAQSMWDEARSAIHRCEKIAPKAPELAGLKQQLAAATAAPAAKPAAEVKIESAAPKTAGVEPRKIGASAPGEGSVAEFVFDASAFSAPRPAPKPPAPFESLSDVAARTQVVPTTPETVEKRPAAAPTVTLPVRRDTLGEFAKDLEASLGDDFSLREPTPTAPAVAPPPPPPVVAQPAASALPAAVAVAPAAAAVAPAVSSTPETITFEHREASTALSDIFAEFKEDVEESAGKTEDAETHYNLGVAFKEMGLLDEAIGELQKVCQAIDRGQRFSQVMQAYTWLAQCFLEKGVPEVGVRWYEKALTLPSDDEASTALHYELASAYEAAGNRSSALAHFMEVYGSNIDYRDVAERIKALKS